MKVLVISDTHGDIRSLERVTELHRDAQLLIFLGDGLGDLWRVRNRLPSTMAVVAVKGNCDIFSFDDRGARESETVNIEGKSIFACHGHRFGVKGGYGAIIDHAHKSGADILLFGHTHLPYESYDRRDEHILGVFNPGSLGHSQDGEKHYGLIELRSGDYLLSAAVLPK